MSNTASRCDQIIALIDACLVEFDSSSISSIATAGPQSLHLGGVASGSSSPTHAHTSR
jgi:hypothetical protein